MIVAAIVTAFAVAIRSEFDRTLIPTGSWSVSVRSQPKSGCQRWCQMVTRAMQVGAQAHDAITHAWVRRLRNIMCIYILHEKIIKHEDFTLRQWSLFIRRYFACIKFPLCTIFLKEATSYSLLKKHCPSLLWIESSFRCIHSGVWIDSHNPTATKKDTRNKLILLIGKTIF